MSNSVLAYAIARDDVILAARQQSKTFCDRRLPNTGSQDAVEDMLTTPLSATGTGSATHWLCRLRVEPWGIEFMRVIEDELNVGLQIIEGTITEIASRQTELAGIPWKVVVDRRTDDPDPETDHVLQALGLQEVT